MALSQSQFEGLAGFRLALRRFLAFSDVAARKAGVTSQQYQAMLVIRAHPDRRVLIKDLADQMQVRHNSAVQLVDRLVGAGMAERLADPADRRAVRVALTDQGESVLESLAAAHLPELLKHETLLADSLRRLRRIPNREEP